MAGDVPGLAVAHRDGRVGVGAPFCIRIEAIGLPTKFPRPKITTSAPSTRVPERIRSSCTPAGVQGLNPLSSPKMSLPALMA